MADNKDKKVLNVPALRFPEFTEEWKKIRLGDNCNIQMCKRIMAAQTNTEGGVPFYKIGTIGGKADAYISKDLFDEYKRKYSYPNKGEVMITCAGTVGKCVIYDGEDSYYQDSNIVWIDNPNEIISNDFLYHLLSNINWSYLNSTTIVRIYNDDLRNLKLCCPRLDEQKKIANFLSLIDERIAAQNKIIEKLQSLIKGLSQQLLSSENDWILYRLDDLAQIKSGYSGTQVSYQTPYKVSRIETISKHCIDIQRIGYVECIPESYRLNVGNILFSNINSIQYIGNTAYLDKDYGLYHGMNLLRIIPNTTIVRPRFLHLLLCTDWAINHFQTICNKAVSQASINQTALGKSRFPIPPMSVQQQICSMFELTERKLDNEQEYISCLQQQKRYLLQKMFI